MGIDYEDAVRVGRACHDHMGIQSDFVATKFVRRVAFFDEAEAGLVVQREGALLIAMKGNHMLFDEMVASDAMFYILPECRGWDAVRMVHEYKAWASDCKHVGLTDTTGRADAFMKRVGFPKVFERKFY